MAEAQSSQIFLSYARADEDFVDRLEADLRARGQQTWVDRMHLEGGDDWAERIGREVARSTCMIVVLSPEAVASKWVRREITLADERDMPIIPLLFKPVSQVPLQIAEKQYIDFTTAYDQGLQALLRTLAAVFQHEHYVTSTATTPPASLRMASPPSPTPNTISREAVATRAAGDHEATMQQARASEDPDGVGHNLKLRASEERQRITRRRFLIAGAGVTVAAIATPLSIIGWNDLQAYQRAQAIQATIRQHRILTYRGHTDFVNSVAWSPDGTRIASASDDVTVQVWNASDGSNVFIYRGHSDSEYSVAWSPDGTFIASGNLDKTVQVWNASDGSDTFTYPGHADIVFSAAWSPDGTRIASASKDKTVQIWNASDGNNRFIYRGHSDAVTSVAWSSDGIHLASASADNTVQVWSASDSSNAFTYHGHSNLVKSVAWSRDGRIASGSEDQIVQVWNASDGSNIVTYHGHSGSVNNVAWSPDGARIASASSDNTVQVWNASDGSDIFTYHGHSGVVNSVAWSLDGTRIVSGGRDKTVQVWHL